MATRELWQKWHSHHYEEAVTEVRCPKRVAVRRPVDGADGAGPSSKTGRMRRCWFSSQADVRRPLLWRRVGTRGRWGIGTN